MKQVAVSPRFFSPDGIGDQSSVILGEDAARHMRVLRLGPGSPVQLIDGHGVRAHGSLRSLAKRTATIDVATREDVVRPADVHLLVPIADRDRMLWLAEKTAEFGVTSWRPVSWKRSRSVSPRGEGTTFREKVSARMISALEQSGNAWLPMIYPDATLEHALASLPEGGHRVALEQNGVPISRELPAGVSAPVTIAVGPEGGFEQSEIDALEAASFARVSLGAMILRFETAGVAAMGFARAMLTRTGESA